MPLMCRTTLLKEVSRKTPMQEHSKSSMSAMQSTSKGFRGIAFKDERQEKAHSGSGHTAKCSNNHYAGGIT